MRPALEKPAQAGSASLARRAIGASGALALLLSALAAAGCGSAIPSSQGGPARVSAQGSGNGAYLVDQGGHALYIFLGDRKGESRCSGACASVWPPYETSARPSAGGGVSQAELGTISREGGHRQVTYAGAPLYYYAGDAGAAGSTKGQGVEQFGAPWYLVSPRGGGPATATGASGRAASEEGEGSGSGGGGY